MAAPNRAAEVKKIHDYLGNPRLTSHEAADHFTAQCAATLHFGSLTLGIEADPNWGRRRNPSGVLSDDVLQYRETGENIDIISGAGGPNPSLVWNDSTPGPWVAPERDDIVGQPGQPGQPGNGGNGGNPPANDLADVKRILNDVVHRIDTLTSAISQLHATIGGNAGLPDFVEEKKNEINKFTDERMHQCINEITAVVNNATKNIQQQAEQNEANDRCVFRR